MAFTLGQMLGGWQKKGGTAKGPRKEHDSRSTKSSRQPERVRTEGVAPATERGLSASETTAPRSKRATQIKGESDLAWEFIVAPHISEKSTLQGDNKYIFKVSDKATKGTIKRAIQERYKVEVESLNVLNMPGKKRRRGAVIGIKSGFKKAVVGLKKGQTINEF